MRPLPELPVLDALPALRAALAREGRAVLSAPPGSGKTTVIPLALLDEPWLRGKKIVVLEPRRIAARQAARRMAFLRGEPVGETVGYQVRFERKTSARTRIEVITEGLLTRRLQSDAELPGVGLVIFDEFHERSLDVDLALALTLDARANLNPELRVLVMSATLDIGAVSELLGGAPVVESAGRLHPVTVKYRPPRGVEAIDAVAAQGVLHALSETSGDLLVFLPGVREIRGTQRMLGDRARATIHALYGDLSSADQDAALMPSSDGTRKVILATNLAQTSLTVEGVTTVVDTGFARAPRFDLGDGANRLETLRVSRASADQRAGRAGRLGPGTAYRLWSEEQHGRLPAYDTPEILSADLTRFALELASWGFARPEGLALMNQPPESAWSYARERLQEFGALDSAGRISAHGRELARLPTAPRLAHMLLRANGEGLATTAAWIAALLEEREAGSDTDLVTRLQRLRGERGRAQESVRQLLRLIDAPDSDAFDAQATGRVLAWAFPERIARRRTNQNTIYQCEDGGEARIHERDALAGHEWLAIAHWDPARNRAIRLAAPLSESEVLRDHADRIVLEQQVRWDPASEAVISEEQRRLGALVLQRKPLRSESAREAQPAAMLSGIRQLGISALPWSESTRQWQARVLSLRAWRPTENWPEVSDEALAASLDTWLAPYLDGITRRDHLARLDLAGILDSLLDYAGQQKLAKLAPTHLTVPTGSSIVLEYFADGRAPALSVKLQEMFGQPSTPSVNEGRMPAVLHLLSPARRPLAVTQDLAGFWSRTYPEVKKEMKGRYPRHPWPEDPVAAAPTRRAKPRGT